jgi:hypothetical protein
MPSLTVVVFDKTLGIAFVLAQRPMLIANIAFHESRDLSQLLLFGDTSRG